MQSLLLLADDPPPLIKEYFNSVLTLDLNSHCEFARWDVLLLDKVQRFNAQLIVAVAVPLAAQVLGMFGRLREHPSPIPTLAVLPFDVDKETLASVSESTDDFVLWPVHKEELRHRVERLVGSESQHDELESARAHLTEIMGMGQLVGAHPDFVSAIKSMPLIAKSDLPLLITGATGTGKELCARAIHLLSKRRTFPFIAVDCGAIPEHLFENELFGHVRGAFTDANSDQKGLAAMAEGGTLFLDEIDALSPRSQAKLLRFLQERVYRPLGGQRFVNAEIHVITATNRDIEGCVREKLFRSDLFFRLNALRLDLPALVTRSSDIKLLARHFLRAEGNANGSHQKSFSVAALRKLELYDWPGNVRELLNVVQCASLMAEGQQILSSHILLPTSYRANESSANDFRHERAQAIEIFEKRYVEELLWKHDGNVTRAAREAGKDRRVFGRLKKKYGIAV